MGRFRNLLQAALVLLLIGTTGSAQKIPKADDLLKEAKVAASGQNKAIFLVFGASWCEPCHQLDSFLAAPEVAAIFDKYFVIVRIAVGETAAGHPERDNPGSDSLMLKYGGVISGGEVSLPFIAFLDSKTKLIVNSNRPLKGNSGGVGIGFPTEPEEIAWFLTMLQKAVPGISPGEIHTVQETLRKTVAEIGKTQDCQPHLVPCTAQGRGGIGSWGIGRARGAGGWSEYEPNVRRATTVLRLSP